MAAEQREKGAVSGAGESICVTPRDRGCDETSRLCALSRDIDPVLQSATQCGLGRHLWLNDAIQVRPVVLVRE